MNHTPELTAESFGPFTDTADLVLVDFHASWCGPCKALAPTLDQLGEHYGGQLPIAKLDIDQAPQVAAAHGIRSVPTLMLFRDGKPVASALGVRPKAELQRWIEQVRAA